MADPEELAAQVKAAVRTPGLRQALDREGLALFKKKPGYGYVRKDAHKRERKLRSPLEDPAFAALATAVVEQGRTLLGHDRLYALYQALENVVAAAGDGPINLLEVGVYRGGSAHFLASTARALAGDRVRMAAVDTFEGHSELDLPDGPEGPHHAAAFSNTGFEEVAAYLGELGFVEVLPGRIQDVAERLPDGPIHFAHIDVDIYGPTAFALQFVDERLAAGGAIVVDDYGYLTCPGVEKAVDEFVAARRDRIFMLELGTGQCCLIPRPLSP